MGIQKIKQDDKLNDLTGSTFQITEENGALVDGQIYEKGYFIKIKKNQYVVVPLMIVNGEPYMNSGFYVYKISDIDWKLTNTNILKQEFPGGITTVKELLSYFKLEDMLMIGDETSFHCNITELDQYL